jgi:RNA polymerase sigma-70 factor (ECF subfamily)
VHTDLALAERCRANAPDAFEELYRAHAPRLFGLACRLVGRADAEDLLQEIFLAAHRRLGSYRGEAALGTWLFRLATNCCLGVVDRLDLERALAGLPAGARAVFVLHDVEGFEHHEIAELLGVAEGTSKSQLHRARLRLRRVLGRPAPAATETA